MHQCAENPKRPHELEQFRQIMVDRPDIVYRDHNDARNRAQHGGPTTTITYFQVDPDREADDQPPYNEEIIMAKASIAGTVYLDALKVECQHFVPRLDISKALMIRVFANHNILVPRFLIGFTPGDPEEETRAFETIFYGPPHALVARGLLLAKLNIHYYCLGTRSHSPLPHPYLRKYWSTASSHSDKCLSWNVRLSSQRLRYLGKRNEAQEGSKIWFQGTTQG